MLVSSSNAHIPTDTITANVNTANADTTKLDVNNKSPVDQHKSAEITDLAKEIIDQPDTHHTGPISVVGRAG